MNGQTAKIPVDEFMANYGGEAKAPSGYDDIINRASRAHNVDPELIRAMISVESSGKSGAVSGKGAGGLMQLMPATAKEVGVTDRFDPEQNITGGTKYLKKMLDRYDGNETLALAAYNAGAGNVTKYGGVPPFKETQDYIKKITARRRKHQKKMSVDEFMAGYKAGMPAGEPATGPAPAQEEPPLSMLGRGKEALADFFRPSFAPEPTVPAGMEGMPESAIPAGMEMDIPRRRGEISERLGQIGEGITTDSIDNLQAQIEEITSQSVDGALPPDLYEQYTALRPQYEQAIENYNAQVTEAQELGGELEDLKQQEYGAEMMRPISTVTGEPVPTFEEEAAGGRAAMAIVPYGFASAVRGLVPGALERAVMDPITKTVVGKEYVSPIDEALKIGKYLPEAGQMAIGAPAHMAGMVVPLRASSQLAGALMKAVGLPPNLVLRTGPVMDRITGHIIHGGLTGAAYGALEAGTPKGMAEDAAFFGALEGGLGAVGGIFRKIFSANWYRSLEVEERGLVVQSLDDMLDRGYSEGEILKKWNNPMWREEALARRAVGETPPEPAASDLSEIQRDLAREVIREEAAKSPAWETVAGGEGIDVMSRVPAIPEGQIPLVPPGMPPSAGPLPTEPAPGVLPPGQQDFELIEPMPEVRLRPGPEKTEGPEYPEGAEYVAGRPAPEELEVEYKPMLRVGGVPWKTEDGVPWKTEEGAISALESGEDVSRATHKVVAVKGGFGIVPLADKRKRVARKAKPEEVKGKTLIAFVRAMGGIKDATLPGEIRALSGKETGVVGLTTSRPEKGLGFDEMASAAAEHGWLPEGLENETEAFSELLKSDLFAQKEKKPRIERLEDIAERTEREERWSEFERSEDEELEYFAKHPDKEIDANLDEWQREAVAEIRRRNEADSARKIEEGVASEVEKENPDLGRLKKDEGFPEYIEGWSEKDLLDEEALAEVEAWRSGEEVEKPAMLEVHKRKILISRGFPQPAMFSGEPVEILGVVGKTGRKGETLGTTLEELNRKGGQVVIQKQDGSTVIALTTSIKLEEKAEKPVVEAPPAEPEILPGVPEKEIEEPIAVEPEKPKAKPKPKTITAEMIRAELPEAVKHLPVGRLTHQDMQYAVKALGIRYDEVYTTLEREKPAFKIGNYVKGIDGAPSGKITHIDSDGLISVEGGPHFLPKDFRLAERPVVPLPETPPKAPPGLSLANWVKYELNQNHPITWRDLYKAADMFHGGTQAEGKYISRHAFDAMELGMNLWVKERIRSGMDITNAIKLLDKKQQLLATQTKRTKEQLEFQQFSTPPTHSRAMAWVANIGPSDVVLDPSAGVGSLVTQALVDQPAEVIANELNARRAKLLENLGIKVYRENAAHLNAVLPGKVKPTVILMNPPFSSDILLKGKKKKTGTGAEHIEQALLRLEDGGRLVALAGRGMSLDKPAFRKWWKKIQDQYNVKAVIAISGKEYKKFGTTFDNVLIVIDKTGPTKSVTDIVIESVDKVEDVVPLLEGIHDERTPAGERRAAEPVVEEGIEGVEGEKRPERPVRHRADVVGAEGEKGPVQPGQLPGPPGLRGISGEARAEGGVGVPPKRPREGRREPVSGEEPGKGKLGTGGPGIPSGEPVAPSPGDRRPGIPDKEVTGRVSPDIEYEENKPTGKSGELTDSLFEDYIPSVKVKGSQKHPAPLAESAAMAAVDFPKVSYKPKIPQYLIDSGKVSDAQLEFAALTGQAHEQIMPDGQRAGILNGDGTGVGKGVQQATVILDNWNRGRKKAVWISEKMTLMKETQRDLNWVGMDGDKITFRPKAGEKIKKKDGVLYTTYSTLAKESKEKYDALGNVITPPQSRLDQLVEWLGRDFDGVICFDESHNMANSTEQKDKRGTKPPSKKALAGVHLQAALPDARFVYASATAATEVENLAYAERLGLWGEGTAFSSKDNFIQAIKSGGIAAMEVVASNLKSMGRMVSRTLAYNVPGNPDQTVTYKTLVHKTTKNDKETYNALARAWQIVLENIDAALEETGGNESSAAKRAALGQFWGAQQRFFNQILTTLPVPTLIKDMEKELADGNSCVLQLYNTNEALANRRRAQAQEEGLELEDIDITPRDMIMQYLQKSFPVNMWEEYYDNVSDSTQMRLVKDSVGDVVQDPRAVARRDELMKSLAGLSVPETVMERIVNHFGSDSIAEVTGRKVRLVRKPDGTVVEEKMTPASRARDIESFMDKKKRILIFSNAGGTGKGYHSDLDRINQEKRIHYLVQAGWIASRALQGFGRTHRTNQRFAPHDVLVTTDIAAHKRFFSSIARRLDQVGALTKGERKTTGQGMFSAEMNLENEYADMALSVLFDDLQANRVSGLTPCSVGRQMGFGDISEVEGDLVKGLGLTMQKFLNRMLSMEIDEQNKLFEAFFARLEAQIQYAIDQGIYESGIETLRADKVEKIAEQDVDVPIGKAKYTELALTYPLHPTTYGEIENFVSFGESFSRFAKNKRSGKLYFFRRGLDITEADGTIRRRVVRTSPTATIYMNQSDVSEEKYEQIPKGQKAKKIWDAQVKEAPKTETHTEHLISGTLLPIWDRLPDEIPKIARVKVDDGEVILGRRIAPAHLAKTKRALGMGAEKGAEITEKQALDALLENDATLVLANNWTIKTRTVSGEDRIEIAGPTGSDVDLLEGFGAFTEIIGYKTRVFVPLDRVAEIVGRLIKNKPVVEIQGPRGGAVLREPEALYRVKSSPSMYSALTRAAESKKIPGKMFAEGVINRLKKSPGVKQTEIDAVGLTEWLKGKKIVTKRELVGFLKMNEVVVEETEKGTADVNLIEDRADEVFERWVDEAVGELEEETGEAVDRIDVSNNMPFRLSYDAAYNAAREELESENETSFAEVDHRLPGGEPDSYRELVLRVPHRKTKRELWCEEWRSFQKQMRHKYPGESWAEQSFRKKLDAKDLAALQGFEKEDDAWRGNVDIRKRDEDTTRYKSTHWPDETNVIAHIRGDTHIDPGGKRRFHIAEFQSDLQSRIAELEQEKSDALATKGIFGGKSREELVNLKKLFPWGENWHELVAKKALEYAVRNGFDSISWDTGKTQVDRWESALRKGVDKIRWDNKSRNIKTGSVLITATKEGKEVLHEVVPLSGKTTIGGQRATLNGLIGKELAEKVRQGGYSGSFEGKDLTIGGEFFKLLYDKKIPGFLKKYGKKWGAVVSTGEVDVTSKFTSRRKYVGKIYTIKDIEKALDVANKYGPNIWESPMTGRRQDFPVNRVSVSNQLAGLLKRVKQGVLFTDAMAETSGMLADLFGGKLELMPETKEIHVMDITSAMSRSIQVQGQAVMEATGKYRQGELNLAFGGKKKADEAIESVAKEIEAVSVSRRGVPDRGRVTESKVAKEFKAKRRTDFVGWRLTKGRETQEIAELFQAYRSNKVEILHAIHVAEDGTILAHNAMTSGELSGVSPPDIAKYIYRIKFAAKRLGAAKVHILHNHPSGNAEMSGEDIDFAYRLSERHFLRRPGLGNLLGEFIVIDHGKYSFVKRDKLCEDWRERGSALDVTGQSTYSIVPGTGKWMEKKGPVLIGPTATAAFGQSLAYDKTKVCFVYVDVGNNVVGWSTHDNKILEKSVPALEKILRQQAKGHNASRTVIIADDVKLLTPIVRHGNVGGWLLDIQNTRGSSAREVDPTAFGIKRKPLKPGWGIFEPESPYDVQRTDTSPSGMSLFDDLEVERTYAQQINTEKDEAVYRVNRKVAELEKQVKELTGTGKKKGLVGRGISAEKTKFSEFLARKLSRAMLYYREAQINPEKAEEFEKWATKELETAKGERKIRIKAQLESYRQSQSLTDEQKRFVDETMDQSFAEVSDEAMGAGIITRAKENYVRRIWDLPKNRSGLAKYGFKTFTTAQLQRKFETIYDGFVRDMDLKISGITSSYGEIAEEVAVIKANKNFIKASMDIGVLTTDSRKKGYIPLNASGFSAWARKAGAKIVTRPSEPGLLQIDTHGRKIFFAPPTLQYGAIKIGSTRVSRYFPTEEMAEEWIDGREDPYRINRMQQADVFEKVTLYAPERVGEMLNKMTRTGGGIFETPVMMGLLRFNAGTKGWILLSSFFHHMAGARSWGFGVNHAIADALKKGNIIQAVKHVATFANPIASHKRGLEKVQANSAQLALLVRQGLTLGKMQDWDEALLREQRGMTETLVRRLGAERVAGVMEKGRIKREMFTNSLFRRFFAGLKAEAAVTELNHRIKKAIEKGETPNVDLLAEQVARLINADFGGLHLTRMGRNKDMQKVLRLLLLAPDWTESNFRTFTGMIPGANKTINRLIGDMPPPPGMEKVYRGFWGGVIIKATLTTMVAQAVADIWNDDDEDWREDEFFNNFRRMKWTGVNVTGIYRSLGVDVPENERRIFSVVGHFADPLKIMHPPKLIKGKGSPLARITEAAMSKSDWRERPYTSFGEWASTGKLKKKSRYEPKENFWEALPSIAADQILSMQPIQFGHLLRYWMGEEDGLSALLSSGGAHITTAYKPRKPKVGKSRLKGGLSGRKLTSGLK